MRVSHIVPTVEVFGKQVHGNVIRNKSVSFHFQDVTQRKSRLFVGNSMSRTHAHA